MSIDESLFHELRQRHEVLRGVNQKLRKTLKLTQVNADLMFITLSGVLAEFYEQLEAMEGGLPEIEEDGSSL